MCQLELDDLELDDLELGLELDDLELGLELGLDTGCLSELKESAPATRNLQQGLVHGHRHRQGVRTVRGRSQWNAKKPSGRLRR